MENIPTQCRCSGNLTELTDQRAQVSSSRHLITSSATRSLCRCQSARLLRCVDLSPESKTSRQYCFCRKVAEAEATRARLARDSVENWCSTVMPANAAILHATSTSSPLSRRRWSSEVATINIEQLFGRNEERRMKIVVVREGVPHTIVLDAHPLSQGH